MTFIVDLVANPVFLSAVMGWFTAQASKVIMEIVKYGFSLERLTGSGGMPSAHSATVTALVTAVGIKYGGDSAEFVIALFFAIIVIYDAAGVRKETGKEAELLNLYRKRDIEEGRTPVSDEILQEKMGHTIPEIVVGIIIGVLSAVVICLLPGLNS